MTNDMLSDEDAAYLEEQAAKPGELNKDILAQYCDNLIKLDKEIEELERQTKEKQKLRDLLSMDTIPNLLQQAGFTEVKLENGVTVGYKEDVKASVPSEDPEKKETALTWLRENEAGDLIKTEFIVQPLAELREELYQKLMELEVPFIAKEAVNASSLASFFREVLGIKKNTIARITEDEIPSAFSFYRFRKTTLKTR